MLVSGLHNVRSTLLIPIAAALLSFGSAVANATQLTIYNSFGTNSGAYAISSVGGSGPLADEFLSGSAPSTLDEVSVLFYIVPGYPVSGTISISLCTNDLNGGDDRPGTPLENIATLSAQGPSSGYFTDTFGPSYALAPNTEYWIKMSSSDSEWDWEVNNQNLGTGLAGQKSFFDGSSFEASALSFDLLVGTNSVSPVATPEPASVGLCGLAILGLAASLRRRIV